MRKSRFSEAQIVAILREFDAGASAEELGPPARDPCEHDPPLAIEIRWNDRERSCSSQATRAENAQMQRIIVRQTVKIDAMEELMRKNSWSVPGEPKP